MNTQKFELTAEFLEQNRASLPRTVNEMMDFIGAEPTAALLNVYGGKSLRISTAENNRSKTKTNQAVTELIGEAATHKLIVMLRSAKNMKQLPNCSRLRIKARQQQIIADFDRMTTGADAMTANDAIDRLAEQYSLTHRHLYRVLKQG